MLKEVALGRKNFKETVLFLLFPLRDFILEDMDLAANEISIYDKLSETVDLVRQTGHQCGMSEKAIEKFIRQLLEKNEPQRGPPQYPLLIAIYKVTCHLESPSQTPRRPSQLLQTHLSVEQGCSSMNRPLFLLSCPTRKCDCAAVDWHQVKAVCLCSGRSTGSGMEAWGALWAS